MLFRNLKAMGLGLAVVFAISALTASAASAQGTAGKLTVASGTSATLDGTEIGVNANRITFFGIFVECPGSTTVGHEIGSTPHNPIPAGATEETITPSFVNCFSEDGSGKHKATVTMTSCDLTSKTGETTGGVANTYGISFSIKCNTSNDAIHVDVYGFAASELGGIQCSITIKEQSDLTGAHLTSDSVNQDLTVAGTVEGIHVERSGSGCPTETTTNAKVDINSTIKGTTALGGNVGITVTH